MNQETIAKYKEAGEVVSEAKEEARKVTDPETNLKEITDHVEEHIREQGLEPAFPVNVSINEEAAHYTASPDEERKIKEDDVVKIDIGAHKDGYIADSAITVNPSGEYQERIQQVEEVLQSGLEFLEPGVTVGELGTHIHNQVPDDVSIVRNLTGHKVERYHQHAGLSIPNIRNSNTTVLEEGDVIAVEPFISTGSGKVKPGKPGNIFKQQGSTNVRGRNERKLLKEIEDFNDLPFTNRWIQDFGGRKKLALQKLVDSGAVKSYEVLKDSSGGIVFQAEHTVIVGGDDGSNIVTTR